MADKREKGWDSRVAVREILAHAAEFKTFWKERGPFKYALTSSEFPPVLLEPEEWIFGNDLTTVLKELMQFIPNKSVFVTAPFNTENTGILRPGDLSPWKITHFPEEWNHTDCRAFMPEGHLTRSVVEEMEKNPSDGPEAERVAAAFFRLLEQDLDRMGYTLLTPRGKSKFAAINKYLQDWEADEADAGIA